MGGAWVWVGVWDAEGGCHGSLDEFSWVIACFPITYFRVVRFSTAKCGP